MTAPDTLKQRYDAAIDIAWRHRAACDAIAKELGRIAREFGIFREAELDVDPIPEYPGWPRRPWLMAPDDLHAATSSIEDVARLMLVESGGWGQVIGELMDHRANDPRLSDGGDRHDG
jgi:hypothetical protein